MPAGGLYPSMANATLPAAEVEALAGLMAGRRTLVLTGAGCSTESGISPAAAARRCRRWSRSWKLHPSQIDQIDQIF